MMDWIIPLIIVLPITYVVLIISHQLVMLFMAWMEWDKSDWFHDVNKRNKKWHYKQSQVVQLN